jgi:hypothetical protein
MKRVSYISFLTILLFSITHSLSAQRLIKIDEELKGQSHSMQVKRKGVGGIGRYEFGPYRIISGKAGWLETSRKTPILSANTSIQSSVRQSFIFVNEVADTSIVNLQVMENIETYDGDWFSRVFLGWEYSEITKGEGVFEAVFSLNNDPSPWRLLLIYPIAIEQHGVVQVAAEPKVRGRLTNTKTVIDIKQVIVSDSGKMSLLAPLVGYEFWEGEESLAAVQVIPANRMNFWVRENLDPTLKFVLANAAAALLVKTF